MKIEEAINVLNAILTFVKPGDPPDEHDAIKLGIEALKGLQALRRGKGHPLAELLPGETK